MNLSKYLTALFLMLCITGFCMSNVNAKYMWINGSQRNITICVGDTISFDFINFAELCDPSGIFKEECNRIPEYKSYTAMKEGYAHLDSCHYLDGYDISGDNTRTKLVDIWVKKKL
ncbi:MAG: conserved hypothetical protein [Methanobrevibacter sp. CfCl-M3]